ncbi:copper amine oxidase domain-containing protein [Acetivibrio cellulolyticus]|uniref:copper amine oxidase domain-containing protein n=1 Tax=Acetivibrio cellulolyticus TaxID=35830 RepID=UPI0001E30147|nr:copper amine oxidase domain-containing protein [Acetivibrio cellulolyticus]
MKERKKIMIFTLIAAIAACPLCAFAVGENSTSTPAAKESNQLNITGVVTYKRLETGYYEVNGYRLEGGYDFSKYEGKRVVVNGELSNSMSIFMNKAIKVSSITEVNADGLPAGEEQLVLEGTILLNTLEGGFYELKGFRLTGEYNFSEYAGKVVIISGVEDTSPSAYMTKAIKVSSIKLSDEDKYYTEIETELEETINQLENVKANMPDYIKQYGEGSTKVNQYMEDIRALKDNAVGILEELVRVDGKSVDIAKYEKLGKVLGSSEEQVISLYINGIKTGFEQGEHPFIESGRTLVAFRAIAEGLGAEVSWDEDTKKVTVKKDGIVIELTIGNTTAYVNGSPLKLDVPAKIVNGRTVVPLRFIGESLNTSVDWVSEGQIVVIGEKLK